MQAGSLLRPVCRWNGSRRLPDRSWAQLRAKDVVGVGLEGVAALAELAREGFDRERSDADMRWNLRRRVQGSPVVCRVAAAFPGRCAEVAKVSADLRVEGGSAGPAQGVPALPNFLAPVDRAHLGAVGPLALGPRDFLDGEQQGFSHRASPRLRGRTTRAARRCPTTETAAVHNPRPRTSLRPPAHWSARKPRPVCGRPRSARLAPWDESKRTIARTGPPAWPARPLPCAPAADSTAPGRCRGTGRRRRPASAWTTRPQTWPARHPPARRRGRRRRGRAGGVKASRLHPASVEDGPQVDQLALDQLRQPARIHGPADGAGPLGLAGPMEERQHRGPGRGHRAGHALAGPHVPIHPLDAKRLAPAREVPEAAARCQVVGLPFAAAHDVAAERAEVLVHAVTPYTSRA